MRLETRCVGVTLAASLVLAALACSSFAQESGSGPVVASVDALPEGPQPQFPLAVANPRGTETVPGQGMGTLPDPDSAASQESSSSQSTAPQSDAEKSQHEKAEEQLKAQEHQRVAGVMATFNTTTNKNALPLSPGQKFQLFFKSETDPWPFLLAGVVSGIGQADDSYSEWGQGAQGYAKRFGAAYSDAFIGNFFGNAVLTSLLHEDPRYFQKGTGSAAKRFLWAASSTVWCKRDKGGWGPNYANVMGNLIGAAISNVYYPASEHTVSNTINDGLTVSAEGIVGSEVIEFWPDMARSIKRKHDEKLARKAAESDAKKAAQSTGTGAPSKKDDK
ncbi:MAG: hypothetical protein WCA11_04745 [Terracidiphilus sp.]